MGLAIAQTLAADGARVAVMARGQEALDAATESLLAAGAPDAVGISVDMTDAESIAAGFEAVAERWGALNSLVHTIGPGRRLFRADGRRASGTPRSRWAPCPACGRFAPRCRCCAPPTGRAS